MAARAGQAARAHRRQGLQRQDFLPVPPPGRHRRRPGRPRENRPAAPRRALDLHQPALPAHGPAVRRRRRRQVVSAVHGRLHKAAGSAARRGQADRARPGQADHRAADGARHRAVRRRLRRQPDHDLRVRAGRAGRDGGGISIMSDPDVAIVGVGLHPFGRYPGKSAMEMGEDALPISLTDAGVKWEDIQALYAGSMEVKNPEGIVGLLGQTGVPGRAVFTGCATGATSLAMAANAIRLGDADVAIAIGLDKHPRGAFSDDPSVSGLPLWYGQAGLFLTTHFFGMKINRYMHDHGITSATLAKVAAKAFRNGAQTHHAWRRKPLTEDEILNSQVLNYPLTQYMYCGPNEGAAAAVLVRADQARSYTDTPVYIRASTLRSRREGAFELLSPSFGLDIVPGPTVEASKEAYEQAGLGPEDVDLAQLQDTDAGSEVIHLAENGLRAHRGEEKLLPVGATEVTRRIPVNTDGGLLANGEPVGASGLRQVYELVNQLKGRAGGRQVANARVGYAQLYGAPGTAAVTILSR